MIPTFGTSLYRFTYQDAYFSLKVYSLAANDTNGLTQSGTASAGGCIFRISFPKKIRFPAVVICASAQNLPNAPFRYNMSATSAPLGVNFGYQGPNYGKFRPT